MITPIIPRLNIYTVPQNLNQPKQQRTTRPELSRDTVSFKGITSKLDKKHIGHLTELLSEGIENPNFFEKSKAIIGQKLEEIMPSINAGIHNNESGARGFVSRLDDNFVLKIPHWFRKVNQQCIKDNCSRGRLHANRFAAVEDYYGHHIVTFGEIGIMKNATAPGTYTRVGRPYELPLEHGGYDYYATQYLPTCSQLPQESFDRLARNMKTLNEIHSGKYYYEPDTENPNNFLIFNGQFRIVDDLDPTPLEQPNNVTTMLKPLLVKVATNEEAEFAEELIAPRREIFGKILRAAIKTDLPEPMSYTDERILEQCYELSGLQHRANDIRAAIAEKNIAQLDSIFQN